MAETIGGLWELFRLGVKTRFHFRGPYWQWRLETAFGTDRSKWPPLRRRVHAAIDYGKWIHRMRRYTR
jgi:hypothetical protein